MAIYKFEWEKAFPFNWDPQRVGTEMKVERSERLTDVSIQLGSPASGDCRLIFQHLPGADGFHSIGIPSEWGPHIL